VRISVVVPFRNAERHIERCLAALGRQEPFDGEYDVFAVDDGSSDRSAEIVRDFSAVRLLRSVGAGPYAARNLGIRTSEGDVLAFTDADCEPAPDWIRQIAEEFAGNGTEIVVGPRLPADRPRLSLVAAYEGTKDAYVFGGRRTQLYYASAQNMAARRAAFERFGMFRERRRGSDTLLVRRAVELGDGDAVHYSPSLVVRHLEIEGLRDYYAKCLVYGRSIGSLNGSSGRPLTVRERLVVWREAIRRERLTPFQGAALLAALSGGAACWGVGYLGARIAPPKRARRSGSSRS
jgi:glycosyltransferase involved in cell wall biosynthesis